MDFRGIYYLYSVKSIQINMTCVRLKMYIAPEQWGEWLREKSAEVQME